MTSFKSLGLSETVLKSLEELGFETPSDIQKEAIPQLLENNQDLIGLAQTGTGKTAAFGLPLIEKIDLEKDYTQALILAPTRELVQQILEQLKRFSKFEKGLNLLAVYGGASIRDQIKDLKKTRHILCATPGRLIDLVKRKKIQLDNIEYVVLDEADEMLNMGFKEELDEILSFTPEEKRTWLFSATMADPIKKIVRKYMEDPIEIKINSKDKVNKNITHQYLTIRRSDKAEGLMRILDMNMNMRAVVFCKTRRDTQELAEELLSKGYKADAIHGDLSQAQRDRVMGRFKDHQLELLIATDVAARGIDVDDLTHVIHFALPDDKAYYTHRAGRTARAGKKGISLVFINGRENYKIKNLEKLLKISFEKVDIPSSEDVAQTRMESYCKNLSEIDLGKGMDDQIFDRAREIFKDLTKEVLIAKILLQEMNKLNIGNSSRELNEAEDLSSRGGRSRDGRRGARGGRGGRSRRDRGSDRRRGGGGGGDGRGRRSSRDGDRDRPRSKKSREWDGLSEMSKSDKKEDYKRYSSKEGKEEKSYSKSSDGKPKRSKRYKDSGSKRASAAFGRKRKKDAAKKSRKK